MTPFGRKLVELRNQRKMNHDTLARALRTDSVKLTALQNGYDGLPSPVLIFQIERELQLSRFELEDLKAAARISNPQVMINTAGQDAEVVELANLLAQHLSKLPAKYVGELLTLLKKILKKL